jgi:hypothetical protein
MKTSILSSLDPLPYFTLEAVKQLLGDETAAAGSIRTALYRWMKAGHVIPLKKGLYMTRRFFELHRADENLMPAVSAILIPQSYVSMEYILQRQGILSEVTYPVTAVSLKQTRLIANRLGTFHYHHIKPSLYTGFSIVEYLGIPFSQASSAKALFDQFYFRPLKTADFSSTYGLAEELRLNLDGFSNTDQSEFESYIEISKSKKMEKILNNLRKTVWQA